VPEAEPAHLDRDPRARATRAAGERVDVTHDRRSDARREHAHAPRRRRASSHEARHVGRLVGAPVIGREVVADVAPPAHEEGDVGSVAGERGHGRRELARGRHDDLGPREDELPRGRDGRRGELDARAHVAHEVGSLGRGLHAALFMGARGALGPWLAGPEKPYAERRLAEATSGAHRALGAGLGAARAWARAASLDARACVALVVARAGRAQPEAHRARQHELAPEPERAEHEQRHDPDGRAARTRTLWGVLRGEHGQDSGHHTTAQALGLMGVARGGPCRRR
jgi:hypothetical protein